MKETGSRQIPFALLKLAPDAGVACIAAECPWHAPQDSKEGLRVHSESHQEPDSKSEHGN